MTHVSSGTSPRLEASPTNGPARGIDTVAPLLLSNRWVRPHPIPELLPFGFYRYDPSWDGALVRWRQMARACAARAGLCLRPGLARLAPGWRRRRDPALRARQATPRRRLPAAGGRRAHAGHPR